MGRVIIWSRAFEVAKGGDQGNLVLQTQIQTIAMEHEKTFSPHRAADSLCSKCYRFFVLFCFLRRFLNFGCAANVAGAN